MRIVVTGSAGYFGGVIAQSLSSNGHTVVGVDRLAHRGSSHFSTYQVDVRNRDDVLGVLHAFNPDVVVHAAAVLAHERPSREDLWTSNVDGTRVLAECAKAVGAKQFVFISTNCLWGVDLGRPVTTNDEPRPVELYGESKAAAEKVLMEFNEAMTVTVFRSPTIVSSGRLGLLGLLFQFIEEGRKLPVVGSGKNRYQFVYGPDYAQAIRCAIDKQVGGTFNVGSRNVPTVAEMYQALIDRAGSQSRLLHVPQGPTVLALKILHALRLSPLGPYQYNMLGASFEFDIDDTCQRLAWEPTRTNTEMLSEAFDFYQSGSVGEGEDVSAHSRVAAGGVLSLLRHLL